MSKSVWLAVVLPVVLAAHAVGAAAPSGGLAPQEIQLKDARRFSLNLPAGFSIRVAAEGLGRARFMAMSPDGRLFVPDMVNLSDNKKGNLWVLEDFDPDTGRYRKKSRYLEKLRNPNSVAFYTDADRKTWLYLALTDRLVRYAYQPGDVKPTGEPQVLARFPDYGLSYKYGGWHLTRTIAFATDGTLFVSVGSSCNACEEKEQVRATILRMKPDGSEQQTFAKGLRNAVGLRFIGGRLMATNMGADHLGDDRPEDTLCAVSSGENYGWPYCYWFEGKAYADPKYNAHESKLRVADVAPAYAGFPAHSAPLGFDFFPAPSGKSPASAGLLDDSYLVALHGSGDVKQARGYKIVRVTPRKQIEDFLTGFLAADGTTINGRPCDILRVDEKRFLISDDKAGVIYSVSQP